MHAFHRSGSPEPVDTEYQDLWHLLVYDAESAECASRDGSQGGGLVSGLIADHVGHRPALPVTEVLLPESNSLLGHV